MSIEKRRIYRSSEGGHLMKEIRKEVIDSVELYFSPLTAVAREFSKKTGMSVRPRGDDRSGGHPRMKPRHAR